MHHDGIHFFPLPPARQLDARAARHQPRVHGRRPAAPGRHGALDARRRCASRRRPTACRSSRSREPATAGASCGRRATRAGSPRRTPMRFDGPAAGHALLRTAADPAGRTVLGTINNCANGYTPVGHVPDLRGELQRLLRERAPAAIAARSRSATASTTRARATAGTSTTSASTPRAHPNEPNRFGWVVEIDPCDPDERARQAHRARPLQARGRRGRRSRRDGRVVVYMGDDERIEYIYKFVSDGPLPARRTARQPASSSSTARSTSRGSTPTAAASGCRSSHGAERPRRGGGLREPGRRADQRPRRPPTRRARRRWTGRSGSPCTRRPARSTARSPTTRRAGRDRAPAVDPPTRGRTTSSATSSAGRERGGDATATALRLGRLRALRRSAARRRGQARQHQGRRLRLARRALVRRARRALDPDRRLDAARSTRATTRTSATTRCWPPIRRPARSGAS